ncbi:hypothetical protein [Phyllobacterium myrsinacearum]|uniref:Uncharacterized protein n=1 Tax=Phyllobacterium myrsinacearum TaxID=28101 RepID=A0A2S9JDH6_9HYPH|nr:hypothetical protein [Phyllobacterium myrsinacearum]PRD50943.1 hypothetical protein C5750_19015 [Phyllobacterium myrsinacearum]PWV88361.1 hypothetical protein DEV92_111170 [Phyllobacterium myrsinacearum]RZS88804.1 hypothetical protein EV217_1193 [Phyllobacterium myrsinacearum]RZU97652.1 hypothetical protein EV654_4514 [Phyllobacterium myrsinacearum]
MTIDANMLIYAIFMINLIGVGGFFAARYEFSQLEKETERSRKQIALAREHLRERGLPAE